MQSHHTFEEHHPGQPVFQARPHYADAGVSAGAGSQAAPGTHLSPAASTLARQAEWAVMHPDHHDLEWHYWRGGWAG